MPERRRRSSPPRADAMARCRARLEELSAYLDGDVTPARARALERHLAGCACCRTLWARLRRTVRICREAGEPPMPSALRRRARARARELAIRRRR